MKISDLFEVSTEIKPMTITAASSDNQGNIDRSKAEKIVDPRGYFARNKKSIKTEHLIVPDMTFDTPTLTHGSDIGKINLNTGSTIKIYVKTLNNVCQIIAHENNEILGFLTLVILPNRQNLAMAKNAQSYIQGKNLLLNLILWAKRQYNLRIISDYEMTSAGEKAWQSMSNNPQLNVKIYNFDQDKIYDQHDADSVRPENDSPIQGHDTTWFYIIENQMMSKFGLGAGAYSATSILQPLYYADDSIPDSL